jgi:hypothetical protein
MKPKTILVNGHPVEQVPNYFKSNDQYEFPTIKEFDYVNKPKHYNYSGIECLDAIQAVTGKEGFEAYLQGNIMKYLWRYRYKNGVEDLKKAEFYLNKLIQVTENAHEV